MSTNAPVGDFLDFMPEDITLAGFLTKDGSGKPTSYGAAVPYKARIELKNRLIRDHHGREVMSRGRVFVGTTVVPTVDDLLTLPAEYVPRTPPLLAVNPVNDENGIHHITIEIG